MGREPFYVNTYSLSMIVFLNRKRVTLFSDELFNSIQDQFPAQLRLQPYASINLSINSVILNDTEVWAREYSSEYRLTAEENLIQVNYTVEVAFLKGCFVNC
jgi:sulfur relay (sulfurtransferase) DsrF/TusC family protein